MSCLRFLRSFMSAEGMTFDKALAIAGLLEGE